MNFLETKNWKLETGLQRSLDPLWHGGYPIVTSESTMVGRQCDKGEMGE